MSGDSMGVSGASLESAKMAASNGDFRSAIHEFSKVLRFYPHQRHFQIDGLLGRARAYIQLGQYVEAISDLNTCNAMFPGSSQSADILWCRGEAYRLQNILSRAIHDFDCALREYPRFVDALLSRGKALMASKNYSRAEHDFSGAIRIEASCFEAYILRSQSFLSRASPDIVAAMHDLNGALLLRPSHADTLLQRSRVALRLGAIDDAFKDYHTAVLIDVSKSDPDLLRHLQLAQQHRSRHVQRKRKSCDSIPEMDLPALRRHKTSPLPYSNHNLIEHHINQTELQSCMSGKENLMAMAMHIE